MTDLNIIKMHITCSQCWSHEKNSHLAFFLKLFYFSVKWLFMRNPPLFNETQPCNIMNIKIVLNVISHFDKWLIFESALQVAIVALCFQGKQKKHFVQMRWHEIMMRVIGIWKKSFQIINRDYVWLQMLNYNTYRFAFCMIR